MGIKEKLFGGIQNQPQQRVADNIVNPQYNINPDGSVSPNGAPPPVQNPFMQNAPQMNFGAQQQNPYMQPQQNYPVMDNNQQFVMEQPNEPNAYFTGQPSVPEGYPQQAPQYNAAPEGYPQQAPQYNAAPEGYPQQAPQYNAAPEGYPQQAPQYNAAPEGYPQQAPIVPPQGFDPNGGQNGGNF